MGIYVYTLRKNPIVAIDSGTKAPTAVGYSKFAYKVSSGWNNPTYNRTTSRLHSLAEKARDANPNLVMMTIGDPKDHDFAKYGPMAVYRVSPELTAFYDTKAPGERIGELHKFGKSYVFDRCEEKVAA